MSISRRSAVFVTVVVALLVAFASCADAASIVPKAKARDITILEIKGSTIVDASSTVASAIKLSTGEQDLIPKNLSSVANNTDADDDDDDDAFYNTMYENTLSAMWYLGTFGGLVLFFFAVTCVEMFFGNPLLPRNDTRQSAVPRQCYVWDAPPAYHLFAPPSYDDIVKGVDVFAAAVQQQQQQQQRKQQRKSQLQFEDGADAKKLTTDVYVVPVHCAGSCTNATAAVADVKMLEAVMTRL